MPNPKRRCVVLVVDDDLDIRETLADMLLDEGYEVVVADDGAEGIELALARTPDVILVDQKMPGLSGLDVTRELRARGCSARVILTTASRGLRESAAEALADGVLEKPFEIAECLELVERVRLQDCQHEEATS